MAVKIPIDSLKALKGMILKNARKILVVTCSLMLIGGAIFLNWKFLQTDTGGTLPDGASELGSASFASSDSSGETADSFFVSSQISRQRARDEAIEALTLIMDSEDALEEVKTGAMNDISRIASYIESEANIETLVMSKGLGDCVAVIGADSVSVIVRSDGLLPNEVAQIKEIAVEQSGIEASRVKIIEKSGR